MFFLKLILSVFLKTIELLEIILKFVRDTAFEVSLNCFLYSSYKF